MARPVNCHWADLFLSPYFLLHKFTLLPRLVLRSCLHSVHGFWNTTLFWKVVCVRQCNSISILCQHVKQWTFALVECLSESQTQELGFLLSVNSLREKGGMCTGMRRRMWFWTKRQLIHNLHLPCVLRLCFPISINFGKWACFISLGCGIHMADINGIKWGPE